MAQERLNDSNSYVYMAGIVSSKHRFCGLGVGYPGVFTVKILNFFFSNCFRKIANWFSFSESRSVPWLDLGSCETLSLLNL